MLRRARTDQEVVIVSSVAIAFYCVSESTLRSA